MSRPRQIQTSPETGMVAMLVGRGDVLLYRPHEPNHCPRCGGQQWDVRRITAECAFCATALPLVHPSPQDPERTDQ